MLAAQAEVLTVKFICKVLTLSQKTMLPTDGGNYSQIYPSNFIPSPCHRFIKAIEDRGKVGINNIFSTELMKPTRINDSFSE